MSAVSILFILRLYFLFFFVSSGMDSNSQTSQELLIPNDVRPSNSKVKIFFPPSPPFLVLFVFSRWNNKTKQKKKNKAEKREISLHLTCQAAQEQVTAAGGDDARLGGGDARQAPH